MSARTRKPFLLLLLMGVTQWSCWGEEGVPYFFYDFEPPVAIGELKRSQLGLQVRQGVAQVKAGHQREGSTQHVSLAEHYPHSATLLTGRRFASENQSHAEVWVRPQATTLVAGEEFMDSDGAVIGLFLTEDGTGAEFQAFHQTAEDTGYWLSTGRVIELDENGQAAQWHRLNVTHHWATGHWALALDGVEVLTGMNRCGELNAERFECWIYGQVQGACEFDDLLITPIAPDELEAKVRAGGLTRRTLVMDGVQTLPTRASAKKVPKRRHTSLPETQVEPDAATRSLDVHLKVVGGGRHITEVDINEGKQRGHRLALYSPGYDDKGEPLPLKVEIRSDAHLSEGLVLADLQWAVTEHQADEEQRPRPVIVHGDFSTGPTQLATVPSKWSNKGLSITVGVHLIDRAKQKLGKD